ncbi:unnamed protein product, partial [Notodromas monacha]
MEPADALLVPTMATSASFSASDADPNTVVSDDFVSSCGILSVLDHQQQKTFSSKESDDQSFPRMPEIRISEEDPLISEELSGPFSFPASQN